MVKWCYECSSYTGQSPARTLASTCIIRQSLKLILCLIGSQCSFIMCSVTWSRGQRLATRHTTQHWKPNARGRGLKTGVWPAPRYNCADLIVLKRRRVTAMLIDWRFLETDAIDEYQRSTLTLSLIFDSVQVQPAVKPEAKISYCRWWLDYRRSKSEAKFICLQFS